MMRVYLLINLWLGLSWLLFRLIPQFKISSRARKVIAQSLLSLSILAPLGLALLPERTFPRLERTHILTRSIDGDGSFKVSSGFTRILNEAAVLTEPGPRDMQTPESFANCLQLFLFGAALLFSLRVMAWIRLQRFLKRTILLHKLGRVLVTISDDVEIPFSVWMAGRAFVVLPAFLLPHRRDFRIALRHEIEHHRRRDTLWAQGLELMLCAFYLNPAAYALKNTILQLQELACDEALINRMRIPAQAYGSCLLRVAEAALNTRSMHVGTTCMIPDAKKRSHSFLKRRFKMFVHHEKPPRPKAWAIAIGTIASLIVMIGAYAAQATLRSSEAVNSKLVNGKKIFDPKIQRIATVELQKGMAAAKASAGFAIVSEASTGAVIAAVSLNDGFDPGLKDDWALSYPLEPGSALKPMIIASALQRGKTTAHEIIDTGNGEYQLGSVANRDVEPFGKLTTADVVAQSSNIGTIKIAEKLGAQGLEDVFHDFGMGAGGTARDFPGAQSGTIPSSGTLPSDNYLSLISQGVSVRTGLSVTPLEVVQAYSAIANGGHLLRAIPLSKSASPELVREVLSPEVASEMRKILRRVVTDGTGKGIRNSVVELAGKTSTIIINGNQRVGGFVGFAPAANPKIVVYVMIFDPKITGAWGSTTAAPVFREITEKTLKQWPQKI